MNHSGTDMSIQHTVEEIMLARDGRPGQEILTKEAFARWDRDFLFQALQGQRYGQAFCNHFGITDHILFYEGRNERALEYIQKTYLR